MGKVSPGEASYFRRESENQRDEFNEPRSPEREIRVEDAIEQVRAMETALVNDAGTKKKDYETKTGDSLPVDLAQEVQSIIADGASAGVHARKEIGHFAVKDKSHTEKKDEKVPLEQMKRFLLGEDADGVFMPTERQRIQNEILKNSALREQFRVEQRALIRDIALSTLAARRDIKRPKFSPVRARNISLYWIYREGSRSLLAQEGLVDKEGFRRAVAEADKVAEEYSQPASKVRTVEKPAAQAIEAKSQNRPEQPKAKTKSPEVGVDSQLVRNIDDFLFDRMTPQNKRGRELTDFLIDLRSDRSVQQAVMTRLHGIATDLDKGDVKPKQASAVLRNARQGLPQADLRFFEQALARANQPESAAKAEKLETVSTAEALEGQVRAVNELLEAIPDTSPAKRAVYRELGQTLNEMDEALDKQFEGYRPHVFISWSHRNGPLAHAVKKGFQDRNVKIWFDEEKLAGNVKQPVKKAVVRGPNGPAPVRGDFNHGIKEKGIPKSSEVVFLLTKEVFAKFGEVKKEIVRAIQEAKKTGGNKELLPILVGSERDHKEFARRLQAEGLGDFLKDYPPQKYGEDVDGHALAGILLEEMQRRHTAKQRPGSVRVKSPAQQAEHHITEQVLGQASAQERQMLEQVLALRNNVAAVAISIDQIPASRKPARKQLFTRLDTAMKNLNQGLEAQFAKFRPELTYLAWTSGDEKLGRQLKVRLEQANLKLAGPEDKIERASYGVFPITRESFQGNRFNELSAAIKNFMDRADAEPDNVDLVPVWIGTQDDYGLFIAKIKDAGLGHFADFLAATVDPSIDADSLANIVIGGIQIREKEHRLDLVWGMDYNTVPDNITNSKPNKPRPTKSARRPVDPRRRDELRPPVHARKREPINDLRGGGRRK